MLEELRLKSTPTLPPVFRSLPQGPVGVKHHALQSAAANEPSQLQSLRTLFPRTREQPLIEFVNDGKQKSRPLRVGFVLSGGPAPGGHNVVAGLFDALKTLHPDSQLVGFLNGPAGLVKNDFIPITAELLARYRNTGGFDIVGSGRGKIETPQQLSATRETVDAQKLDGIVVVGGDDSNTNAAVIAEYLRAADCKTVCVGVPKTIDGDLANEHIEISFGFDTACKNYSTEVSNLARDCRSSGKYYFFVKMMGRSASHITLECAMQTRPNVALISEEIEAKGYTMASIASQIADVVVARAKAKKSYGIVLVPEGVIEFIPEFKTLIEALNKLLAIELHGAVLKALKKAEMKVEYVASLLSGAVKATYESIPLEIQTQLVLDRDPHGNVNVSQIETEKFIGQMVAQELQRRAADGKFKGEFAPMYHFCGYQGRSGFPSNFDAQYCYALGFTAASLVHTGVTGYIACIKNLALHVDKWEPKGVPLASMLVIEERKGKPKPVIQKALVNLDSHKFQLFVAERAKWAADDAYLYPGPLQFFGPPDLAEARNFHLLSLL